MADPRNIAARSASWNDFRREMHGRGLSMAELGAFWRARLGPPTQSTDPPAPAARLPLPPDDELLTGDIRTPRLEHPPLADFLAYLRGLGRQAPRRWFVAIERDSRGYIERATPIEAPNLVSAHYAYMQANGKPGEYEEYYEFRAEATKEYIAEFEFPRYRPVTVAEMYEAINDDLEEGSPIYDAEPPIRA